MESDTLDSIALCRIHVHCTGGVAELLFSEVLYTLPGYSHATNEQHPQLLCLYNFMRGKIQGDCMSFLDVVAVGRVSCML